jgi:ketosteroid isomerase-like protein
MAPRIAATWGVLLLVGVGCRQQVDPFRDAQALLETDKEWARLTSAGRSPDSILAYWTEDARVVSPGLATREGKRAIRQMVTGSLAARGFHITWTPEAAVVSRSGDLGYTYGSKAITIPGPTGKTSTIVGRYLAVWRKEPDGRWRCVMDYSTPERTSSAPSATDTT